MRMNRRWQADGIPFWRKLFSSNWWWYGEVHPDPATLPPPEKRPKFWRWDVVFLFCCAFGPLLPMYANDELNNRYWPFNQTKPYVGRIVATDYYHPQIKVELVDQTVVSMGFPGYDGFGFLSKPRPRRAWIPTVDNLTSRQYDCPDRLLVFEAEPWKLTFKPLLNIWEVRCASAARAILISQQQIEMTRSNLDRMAWIKIGWTWLFIAIFYSVCIIYRERKLYVKN
jgi:hypothetical protein